MKSSTLNIIENGSLLYIQFPKLSQCSVVRHIFSTRMGGVSKGRYSSMNLSFTNGDSRENVIENYNHLCSEVGIDIKHLVLSKQTHTNNIMKVTHNDCGKGIFLPSFENVDGLITNQSGVALVTQYADCTPLLFCDPKKKVIASSHAGWRGTVKEIGKLTVEKMVVEYGCNRNNIIACIGPCIDKCCYEVDDVVYNEIIKIPYLNINKILSKKENGKYMMSLIEINHQILNHSGILDTNMDISDICTCCNSNYLHSHRATNGQRGNLAAIIELK